MVGIQKQKQAVDLWPWKKEFESENQQGSRWCTSLTPILAKITAAWNALRLQNEKFSLPLLSQ